MDNIRLLMMSLILAIAGIAYAGDSVSAASLPLTKETAAKKIQSLSGGKILSVEPEKSGGKQLFKVKVLYDDGKIKVYQLDAKTGLEVQ